MTDVLPKGIKVPEDPDELREFLYDQDNAAWLLAQPKGQGLDRYVLKYAQNVLGKQVDIMNQAREMVETTLAEFIKENRADGFAPVNMNWAKDSAHSVLDVQGSRRSEAHAGLFNPQAIGAPLNKDFQGPNAMAQYFSLIWHNRHRDAEAQVKLDRIRNAFSSEVPSEGGFLIPENLRSELLRVALETSVVRSRARIIPMETLRVPFPAIDSTSNATSVYGGIVAYWTQEGASLTDTQASFSRIVLEAKKLTAYTQIPNELISDSIISFQAFIDQLFPEALGFYEDIAFLKGSGVGEPLGALSSSNPALVPVAARANQTAGTIIWENLVDMYARMMPGSLNRAVWLVTPDAFPDLATMALSVGTGGAPVWLTNGAGPAPMTILGRPVIVTEKAPAVKGTQGDISFVDFGFYLVGDRQTMSAMSSPHFRFQNDETAYRIIERVDGMPWLQSAITPQNGGDSLTPFVQVATRS